MDPAVQWLCLCFLGQAIQLVLLCHFPMLSGFCVMERGKKKPCAKARAVVFPLQWAEGVKETKFSEKK